MGLLGWLFVGFVAGWLGARLSGRTRGGCVTTIAVGILGAFIGGAIARAAGYRGVTDLSLRSIGVAALGSTLLLALFGSVDSRRGGPPEPD